VNSFPEVVYSYTSHHSKKSVINRIYLPIFILVCLLKYHSGLHLVFYSFSRYMKYFVSYSSIFKDLNEIRRCNWYDELV